MERRHIYGIFGSGGFGCQIMPIAHKKMLADHPQGNAKIFFILETDSSSDKINGYDVISRKEFINMPALSRKFNVAIGDSKIREKVVKSIENETMQPFSVKSFTHIMYDYSEVGEGAIFCDYTTVMANSRVGRFFHANLFSYVGHDCIIGDYVTFAPNVLCSGSVVIGDHAYVGAGAMIKHGTHDNPITIGEGAVIGMGAVVVRNVPPFSVVAGNPAKVIKFK